jgi:hypothetical protein
MALAILSYLLIFVDGEHVGGPMIILMFLSVFETDLVTQILIALSSIGLITLIVLAFLRKTTWTFFIEAVICVLLALPIINELQYERFRLLHYPMFVIPTLSFLILYLLSLYFFYGFEKTNLLTKAD